MGSYGNQEAFASVELLQKIHAAPVAAGIVKRCRETMIDFARVIEEWALRYEIASLNDDDNIWGDGRAILRGKAEALREDVPRIVEQVLEGRDIPPRELLEQLEDLLDDGDDDRA